LEVSKVLGSGESQREAIRPDFNRAIMIDFQGAIISSDTGFILLREEDERFKIIDPVKNCLEDLRLPSHTRHSMVQMVRQRVYHMAAGYEDCNDVDFLRIDPALRLALGKDPWWYAHAASAFPLARHYRALLAWGS
jgi:hypothetical protein